MIFVLSGDVFNSGTNSEHEFIIYQVHNLLGGKGKAGRRPCSLAGVCLCYFSFLYQCVVALACYLNFFSN